MTINPLGLKIYLTQSMLVVGLLGFFSGLPLALTAATLTAWLADSGVDRAAIGLFAAITTPYAFKFLWSPLMDGLRLPMLHRMGRRRSWLLFTQILLAASITAMGTANPAIAPGTVALIGLAIAICSASQDIVIDAYRVERLSDTEQAAGAAAITFGYRIGLLVSGAGALALADHFNWHIAYFIMGGIMACALLLTLMIKEPAIESDEILAGQLQDLDGVTSIMKRISAFFRRSVIAPFSDFMQRPYWLAVLIFVVLYKLGDAFMGVMFNPFLLDIGFSKTQIAEIVKLYGLAATLLGTFAGGATVARFGMFKTLIGIGFLHMLTNLMLVVQARLGADTEFLALSIALENFTGGISIAAFIGYLSTLCNRHYTATQYALLSSLAAFGRTVLSTPSGALAETVGWEWFFTIASLMAVPSLILLWWLEKRAR